MRVRDDSFDHTMGLGTIVIVPNLTTVSALLATVAQAGNDGRHQYSAVSLDPAQISNI